MNGFSPIRTYFSIAAVSSAIIAYQLSLMQVLSIVQWYHFAYMVISVALLGFGAAGSFLSVFRSWLLEKSEIVIPSSMCISGVLTAAVIPASQLSFFRFDTYLLFYDYRQVLNLFLTYLLFFLPFFTGALSIGLFFVKHHAYIGKLYFANMAGSGIGGIIAVLLMWVLFPNELPAIISFLPVVSGIVLITKRNLRFLVPVSVISAAVISAAVCFPPKFELSQFKSISKSLELPGSTVTIEKNSPYGFLQVVSSEVLRYAPGLSLNYKDTIPVRNAVYNNGNWLGAITSAGKGSTGSILDYSTGALPYVMSVRKNALILNSGTGMHILQAVSRRTVKITASESDRAMISLMKNELARESDSIYYNQTVELLSLEARTFLQSDSAYYDLIVLPSIDAFGGASGLNALQEQYTFTKEAVSAMWQRLTLNGVIAINCWMDYPLKNPLKALATFVEVLEEHGITKPSDHITAVRSWGNITFVLKRTPVTAAESGSIRDFCRSMMFDPVMLPDIKQDELNQFNKLQEKSFFTYLEEILSPQKREELYSTYDFNLEPATDNKPYFSQFLKWASLKHLAELYGGASIPFFELGYLVVVITFFEVLLASLALIILPLLKLKFKGQNKIWVLLYFSGIGLGYMFVEIVFIQRFIFYFGIPIYSSAAVISIMLICSGIGSYFSSKLKSKKKGVIKLLFFVIALLLTYSAFLNPVLNATIGVILPIKVLLAFLIIAPLAFFMGFIFPIGIDLLSETSESQIPWAWGINGSVSVVSTVLATIISVELGFAWVMILAAGAYSLPLVVNIKAS